jgi:N-methylhydantoinase A
MTATPHLAAIERRRDRLLDGGSHASPHDPLRPSTGVVRAQVVGSLAGLPDIITFRHGRTSTDVALLSQAASAA